MRRERSEGIREQAQQQTRLCFLAGVALLTFSKVANSMIKNIEDKEQRSTAESALGLILILGISSIVIKANLLNRSAASTYEATEREIAR